MTTPVYPPLPDQAARDRFCQGLQGNFSVIAPAGVGKTTAIVQRIANLAKQAECSGENLLSSLVVVTYTNKAASEMKERARQRLAESGPGAMARLSAFNSAYFGTIHGFCLELLRRWGHLLGLPQSLQMVEDEELLWNEFLSRQDTLLDGLPEPMRRVLPRYVDLQVVTALARRQSGRQLKLVPTVGHLPEPALEELLAYEPKRKNSIPTVTRNQARVREWLAAREEAERFVGLPELSGGGKDFEALCSEAFMPLRNWLAQATGAAAAALANRFRNYRMERGEVLYEDQISLARQLTQHPEAGRSIRQKGWCVILDEAQDTDPAQFDVLLSVAQSQEAFGDWRAGHLPPPGRFCMVGDPQQSIYSDRADIATYLEVHDALVNAKGGEEATFSVTMRCDEEVVKWVNASGPAALNGGMGQVELVPLEARPDARPGAVRSLKLSPQVPLNTRSDTPALEDEAQQLAAWLADLSPGDFGVADWSEVALLCPRKKSRLGVLERALDLAGVPCQNHGRVEVQGEDPALAWMAGLAAVMAEPGNAFEVAGVLREVFGLSDGALATYVNAQDNPYPEHPLSLLTKPADTGGAVAGALQLLRRMRNELMELPLRSVVHCLIESLQMEARLKSLSEASTQALETIAAAATTCEQKGDGWPELAGSLRRLCREVSDEADPVPGKLQLLTCQKAKGLEWPVVIVPFLFSSIPGPRAEYPLLLSGADGHWTIALDSAHETSEAKASQVRRTSQSLERLLYVTLTRPRHQLILIDDEAFFPRSRGSFAACLRLEEDEENRALWEALPAWKATKGISHPKETKAPAEAKHPKRLDDKEVENLACIQRVLPSSLARHGAGQAHERSERDREVEPDYPELSRDAPGGTGYGNWWHSMMETMPWDLSPAQWRAHGDAAIDSCPVPERGHRELSAFWSSELAQVLSEAKYIRCEVPLLWRASEAVAYDGSIDMLCQLADGSWLLLDWKTDRIGQDPAAELLAAYGPQLAAYREALIDILKPPLKALLFSTRAALEVELP